MKTRDNHTDKHKKQELCKILESATRLMNYIFEKRKRETENQLNSNEIND